ncbi:unnamed protein product [Prorocentrum cordatum]|uniref:Peroxin-14 n=1 Tax=Prorocentrum cordatum TaxID=2364126 RepID=A0ABN9SEV0_9DINO|nr:unnamed protein product [Polarella glacialis]
MEAPSGTPKSNYIKQTDRAFEQPVPKTPPTRPPTSPTPVAPTPSQRLEPASPFPPAQPELVVLGPAHSAIVEEDTPTPCDEQTPAMIDPFLLEMTQAMATQAEDPLIQGPTQSVTMATASATTASAASGGPLQTSKQEFKQRADKLGVQLETQRSQAVDFVEAVTVDSDPETRSPPRKEARCLQ